MTEWRVLLDEDIPIELTGEFESPGILTEHIESLGMKGMRNGELLAFAAGSYEVLVTGDSNLEYQQNLSRYDLAVIVVRPRRLVIEQIRALVPEVIEAIRTAPRKAVMTVGAARR